MRRALLNTDNPASPSETLVSSAGYTGGSINIHAVPFAGDAGESITQVRHGCGKPRKKGTRSALARLTQIP